VIKVDENNQSKLRFVADEEKKAKSLTRKDVFLMTFLAFVCAGLLFTAVFFAATNISNLSGMAVLDTEETEETVEGQLEIAPEEVVEEEPEEVIEFVEEEPEEEVVEEEPEEEVVEEEPEEEVVEEETSDCGLQFDIVSGDSTTIEGKTVKIGMVDTFAAQVSVGGSRAQLMSTGSTEDINGLTIKLTNVNGDTATVELIC